VGHLQHFFSTKKGKSPGGRADSRVEEKVVKLIPKKQIGILVLQITILSYTAIMATYLIMEYFKFTRSQV